MPLPRAASERPTAPGARRWTLRPALARAIEVLRTEGVRALVARAASETVYRRLVLVERDVREPPGVTVPAELAFGYLDERGLDRYDELRPGRRQVAAERLAAGHRCFATWLDGRLVAVRWLATGAPHIEYLDLRLELADGEVYHYDTFTDAAVRRRGISAASQARLFETLRDEGFERVIRAVLPENHAAVADAARAGYQPKGRIGYVRVGPLRRDFVSWNRNLRG